MSLAQQRLEAAMAALEADGRSDPSILSARARSLFRRSGDDSTPPRRSGYNWARDSLSALGVPIGDAMGVNAHLHRAANTMIPGDKRSTVPIVMPQSNRELYDSLMTDGTYQKMRGRQREAAGSFMRRYREQQAEVEALENAARAESILLGNADPRMRAALDTLQRQSEEGPYTEAVQNIIAGRSADSAAAAADSQNQMLMEQMARSGGSMSDAGIMAAQRAIESDRMLSNNAARRDIAIQAALQNYQGQQQAASQLAGLRSGANAQLANLYANATVESPNNQSAVRVAPQSFNPQAATAALPQKDSGSNGNDSSGGVKPVTEDELDEWQKYIDGNNMGGFIRPANPNDNRPMGPARPYSGPIDIDNKGRKSVNINTKDLKGQLWGKPQAPGGVKSSDYRNTKPMARN